jgi:hypothetical protein
MTSLFLKSLNSLSELPMHFKVWRAAHYGTHYLDCDITSTVKPLGSQMSGSFDVRRFLTCDCRQRAPEFR